jgi:hypothetical protein
MDHFQQSHESLTSGVRRLFANLERDHPQPEAQGLLATVRQAVHSFCNSPIPKNHDELIKLSQEQTSVVSAINHASNMLRIQKM